MVSVPQALHPKALAARITRRRAPEKGELPE